MLFNFNVTNYKEYIILPETLKEKEGIISNSCVENVVINKSLPHICKKKKIRRNTLHFYLRH